MATGYCTVDDVRRALRSANLPGDVEQDKDIAIDAIAAQTRTLEKELGRHYYEPGGISEDNESIIPTSVNTRSDEHDLPRWGGMVDGAAERDRYRYKQNSDALLESDPRSDRWRKSREEPKRSIRIATGDEDALEPPIDDTIPAYTRIRLNRRNADTVNTLNIINENGGYDDWVASNDYSGGVGTSNRGDDFWVRINSGGVSDLYLDVHSLNDDIPTLSNAVYIDYGHGREGIPRNVRRAVAFRAGADLVEEAIIEIPQQATIYNIETKAEELREQADRLLEAEE